MAKYMAARVDNYRDVQTVTGEEKQVKISWATLSGIRWGLDRHRDQ